MAVMNSKPSLSVNIGYASLSNPHYTNECKGKQMLPHALYSGTSPCMHQASPILPAWEVALQVLPEFRPDLMWISAKAQCGKHACDLASLPQNMPRGKCGPTACNIFATYTCEPTHPSLPETQVYIAVRNAATTLLRSLTPTPIMCRIAFDRIHQIQHALFPVVTIQIPGTLTYATYHWHDRCGHSLTARQMLQTASSHPHCIRYTERMLGRRSTFPVVAYLLRAYIRLVKKYSQVILLF